MSATSAIRRFLLINSIQFNYFENSLRPELIVKLHTSRRVNFVVQWPIESLFKSVTVVAGVYGNNGDEVGIEL
ncbi:hypothetical protein P8452_42263 [Trifolium repens]|jgi:hypothetical protein|nr:hypothetical protein P8452_42263 [Trifolium repens]